MSVMEMIMAICVGCIVIITFVVIATLIIEAISKKNKKNEKVFIGQLVNSDCSMQEAMNYLKLTNGINKGEVK